MRFLAFIACLLWGGNAAAQTQTVPVWYGATGNLNRTGTNTPLPVQVTGGTDTAITPVVSASAESSHVLKAASGIVYSVSATNLTSTGGFLVLLNAVSAPADGAITPLACATLPGGGGASITYAPAGAYSTGIVAVVTSAVTCFTKTTGVITALISGEVQ